MRVISTTKTSQGQFSPFKIANSNSKSILGPQIISGFFFIPESEDLQIKSLLKVNFIEKTAGTNQTDAVSGLNETDVTALTSFRTAEQGSTNPVSANIWFPFEDTERHMEKRKRLSLSYFQI